MIRGPMSKAILDTSVPIAPFAKTAGEFAISVASLAELQFGILVTSDPAVRASRLSRLSRIQADFTALPMDEAVAISYGQLAAETVRVGRQPRRRQFDLVIAATAQANGAVLITRNVKDFEHLSSLIDVRAPGG